MLKFNICYEINFNIFNILLFRVLILALPKTPSFSAGFYPCKSLIYLLLSSTEVVFGKNLIRTWVEFGKKMVPGKQGVEEGQKWTEMWSEMLNFNICTPARRYASRDLLDLRDYACGG